jgi:hypothetical protein
MKVETIRAGDILAKVFYGEVKKTPQRGSGGIGTPLQLEIRELGTNTTTYLEGTTLIEEFASADRFEKTVDVAPLELARTFVKAHTLPFTVCFTKADGTVRTLRGILVEHEDLLGRSMVKDLDVKHGSPLRQVDHRTLRWLIYDGVMYKLKG